MRHSTSLLGLAVLNLPPPLLPLSLSRSYLIRKLRRRAAATGWGALLAGARKSGSPVDHPLHVALRLAVGGGGLRRQLQAGTGGPAPARNLPPALRHGVGQVIPARSVLILKSGSVVGGGLQYCPGPGILLALYIFHSTSLLGLLVLNLPVAFFLSTGSYCPGPGVCEAR
jgi:hypothetical protein